MDLMQEYDPEFYLDRIEDEPLHQHYCMLHDGLSVLIESGELTTRLPEDYEWLVRMLEVASVIAAREEES